MKRKWSLIAFGLALGAATSACEIDTVSVEPDAGPSLPDLSGTWSFSFLAYPVGSQGLGGSCKLTNLLVELRGTSPESHQYELEGFHEKGEIVCDPDAAEFGLEFGLLGANETAISVPSDALRGQLSWTCIRHTFGGTCGQEGLLATFSLIGIRFRAGLADQESMHVVGANRLAGSLHWSNHQNFGVFYGDWSATRR